MGENTILELKDVKKSFEVAEKKIAALKDINISIPETVILGIIGRSGAGKSTLLRTLNGLERIDSGSVEYLGRNLADLSKEELSATRQEIGMIFQHFNLLSRRTALENVKLILEIANYPKNVINKKALDALRLVGLEGKADAYPSQLSGGQKQRVAIARTLAVDAKVILCDEATSALDPETTEDILHLLRDLNSRLGITIVLITHEIGVIRDICHEVVVMDQGEIVEKGSCEQIFTDPRHEVTRSFTQSIVKSSLPEVVRENIAEEASGKTANAVLRLIFKGELAQKSVIASLVKELNADVSIIAGFIDHIGKTTFGTLIVTMDQDEELIKKALEYLGSQGVNSEILGYIEHYV